MGMRCYQHVGLKPEALKFLQQNVVMVPDSVCPNCKHVISTKMKCKLIRKIDLFYEDGPGEFEYTLKDGRICKEKLDSSPWSSGPVGFTCLEIDGEKMFEWTEAEMSEHL